MSTDFVLRLAKFFAVLGFVISGVITVNYHFSVERMYAEHPSMLDTDIQKVESFIEYNGCTSTSTLFFNTEFGYLQSYYLLSKGTKKRILLYFPSKGVCINPYQLTPEHQRNRNQSQTN